MRLASSRSSRIPTSIPMKWIKRTLRMCWWATFLAWMFWMKVDGSLSMTTIHLCYQSPSVCKATTSMSMASMSVPSCTHWPKQIRYNTSTFCTNLWCHLLANQLWRKTSDFFLTLSYNTTYDEEKHQTNSLSGWDSYPLYKWYAFHFAWRHNSVTHFGPPQQLWRSLGQPGHPRSTGYQEGLASLAEEEGWAIKFHMLRHYKESTSN